MNFVTGMGGFMQNLLQGYLGIRIYDNRLEFTPYLPPDAPKYSAMGIKYQNMSFNFLVDMSKVEVQLTSPPKPGCVLIDETGKSTDLKVGSVYSGSIKVKRMITCQPESINTTATPEPVITTTSNANSTTGTTAGSGYIYGYLSINALLFLLIAALI